MFWQLKTKVYAKVSDIVITYSALLNFCDEIASNMVLQICERVIFLDDLLHVNTPFILASFFVNTIGLYYCFYKAWKTDPGYLHTTTAEQRQVQHC